MNPTPRRIVVVDDRHDALAGRVSWLAALPNTQVIGLSFAEALQASWEGVDLTVLDGRDDRMAATVTIPDGERLVTSHDRFMGPRVAQAIRRVRTRQQTRIVLVSAYARDNDVLARRCFEVGVDYLYDVLELDAERFVSAVFAPDPAAATATLARRVRWDHQGLDGVPHFTEALTAIEGSPAGVQLLFDEPAADHPGMGHYLRRLREDVGRLLRLAPPPGGGPRERHASKRHLSQWLRKGMGLEE